jgi:hypothetical protein
MRVAFDLSPLSDIAKSLSFVGPRAVVAEDVYKVPDRANPDGANY